MPKGILNLICNFRSIREIGRNALTCVQMLFARLWVVNSGAAAAEYTFLVALISIVAVLGMVLVGDQLQNYFSSLANGLDNASTPTSDPFDS
jgi:Flp pilus assembly pilin Flp